MKKQILYSMIVGGILFAGASLAITNNSVEIGFDIAREEERLQRLVERHQELEAEYLALVYDTLDSRAESAGLVAYGTPRYIQPDTALGFVAE